MLKGLRKDISKRKKLPPFVIFQDASLSDMSIQYPVTIKELTNIQGVGEGKARRFGKEFVDLIKAYVEDNEIERAQDLVVKSVANKSKKKVSIIHNIDRKIALEDIADADGMDMDELLSELEAIVYSGTKINVDYAVNDFLDEDHQEEVFDYFKNAETDSIEDALDELGEDEYSEEDLRLARIQFLSNLGN